eukprot:TRINITY_DN42612_c0_g1_i1.p1 TRINITY_DN42612_c0_g1~~TRINITY_DN42612_c0_g1_i1.p1  ORF type:complete len:341 (+),score=165.68 TRINITY_DN42612_c0_g1_i1:57-1079(+)
MFHAEIRPAKTFKQIIESLKEVVNECTFECTQSQMQVQAMDCGQVSLVSLELTSDQFHSYRCEKNLQLGVNVGSLSKMMKCSNADDCVTLRADADGDVLNICLADTNEERVSEFSMKLMEIDSESLGIPQQEYKAAVQLPSAEFAKICRDIANFGDTVTVEVTRDHVAFSASGDIGSGKVVLKASKHLDNSSEGVPLINVKTEKGVKDEKDVKGVKKEDKKRAMEDVDEEGPAKKKRKGEKAKTVGADGVRIECQEPVTLPFALRYLTMFSKAQAVSDTVNIKLAQDVPLQVEFEINASPDTPETPGEEKHKLGYLRYYLAPKFDAGDQQQQEEAPPSDE